MSATSEPSSDDTLAPDDTSIRPPAVKEKPSARRKQRNSSEEHGNSWAKGRKWDFLENRLNIYYQACNDKAWDAFYERSVDEWVEQGFKLEDVGKTPLPDATPGQEDSYKRQLRKRAKTCIKNWYKNRKQKPQNGGSGNKKLKCLLKQGKQRALQPAQGYCHLYYEDPERDMKRKVEEGYAKYLENLKDNGKSMGKLNFCLQIAREMLANEPPEVQSRVELYCRTVGNPNYEEKAEFANYPEEEQIRLANALTTRRNAESIPQMTRAFLDAIYEATGCRGVVGFVGPDPLGVDNIAHMVSLSKGRTIESQLSYERYCPGEFKTFMRSLEHWGAQCITDEERESYSLEPRTAPIAGTSGSFDVVEAISHLASCTDDDTPKVTPASPSVTDDNDIPKVTPASPSVTTLDDPSDPVDVQLSVNNNSAATLSMPAPNGMQRLQDFDMYDDLLPGQDLHSFDWNPEILIPAERTSLPDPNIQPQQTPLYYNPSFASLSSIPSAQPMLSHVQTQASQTYGNVQPVMTFETPSLAQSAQASAHVVPVQVGSFPTFSLRSSQSIEQHQSPVTNGQTLGSPTSFLASGYAGTLREPMRPSPFTPNSSDPVHHFASTAMPSPPARQLPTATLEDSQDGHREGNTAGSTILAIAPTTHTSNKENLAPNTSSVGTSPDVSKGPRKKAVLPRPKARPAAPKNMGDSSWCLKAYDNLRRSLKGPDAYEALARWKGLEEMLGYPGITRKSADIIEQTHAPDCLREFMKSGRLEEFKPERAIKDVPRQFKAFWLSLQPEWRKKSDIWPLTKDSANAAEWSCLLKGGPNGFFLVLKTLSFWAQMVWTKEERADFEGVVADINWVLGELTKQMNGGSVLGVRKRRARA